MHACRVPEITELRRPANPRDKEPKLSSLGVTRRNPDIVRDSEGSLGRHFRPEAPGSPHRADSYRQRAADAKNRAAQARDPSIKSALENVAADWVALADQVERIDEEKSPVRDQENNRSVR